MSTKYGTRTDCTRDNVGVPLPNASFSCGGLGRAKRGNWVQFEIDSHHNAGRVVGRVQCEGKTYVEVIRTDSAMQMAYVNWIEPAAIRACYAAPHVRVMAFLAGEWSDPDKILTTAANGLLREEHVSPGFTFGYTPKQNVKPASFARFLASQDAKDNVVQTGQSRTWFNRVTGKPVAIVHYDGHNAGCHWVRSDIAHTVKES